MQNLLANKPVYSCPIELMWSDLDAYQHVSHIAYLRMIEECRSRWMESVPSAWQGDDQGPVVANINIDYRQSLYWPNTVQVSLQAGAIGRSSLTLAHELSTEGDQGRIVHAEASVTVVWIDKRTGRPVPLPESIRQLAGD